MKIYKICALVFALGTAGVSTPPAFAASSNWMNVTGVRSFMVRLSKQNKLPTQIICKTNPNSRVSPLIKVKYKRNRAKTFWHWAWGTAYRARNGPLLRAGYKRVSNSQTPGAIGTIRCGIWHKPYKKRS